jgi:hypothetical protein
MESEYTNIIDASKTNGAIEYEVTEKVSAFFGN